MAKLNSKLRVGLIGFGLHTQRVYWKCLKKLASQNAGKITIPVLVDVIDKQDCIETFFQQQRSKYLSNNWINDIIPQKNLYVTTSFNNNYEPDSKVLNEIKSQNLDALIISTDPRSRKQYLQFAIEHNIRVLCDKPLLIPSTFDNNMNMDTNSSNEFESEYIFICNLLKQKQKTYKEMDIILSCQRRRHSAHMFVIKYLHDFITEFQIPMNFIHINHNDGLFLTPNEYANIENHPFRYGYGKLFNSGYHFIDLLLWYQSISNHSVKDFNKKANQIELCGHRRYSVYDDYYSLTYDDLNNLYQKHKGLNDLKTDEYKFKDTIEAEQKLHNFGELDSYNLLQFKHADNIRKYANVITTASVQLLHKSFSRRSWIKLPRDVNKENGRVRHELLTIMVGPLLTIHIRSFQSFEDQKLSQNNEQSILNHEIGGANHFEVDIFRNSQLCGGKTYEQYNFGLLHDYNEYESLMFESRYKILYDFFNGKLSDMSILSKNSIDTVRLISSIYKNIAKNNGNNVDTAMILSY